MNDNILCSGFIGPTLSGLLVQQFGFRYTITFIGGLFLLSVSRDFLPLKLYVQKVDYDLEKVDYYLEKTGKHPPEHNQLWSTEMHLLA